MRFALFQSFDVTLMLASTFLVNERQRFPARRPGLLGSARSRMFVAPVSSDVSSSGGGHIKVAPPELETFRVASTNIGLVTEPEKLHHPRAPFTQSAIKLPVLPASLQSVALNLHLFNCMPRSLHSRPFMRRYGTNADPSGSILPLTSRKQQIKNPPRAGSGVSTF